MQTAMSPVRVCAGVLLFVATTAGPVLAQQPGGAPPPPNVGVVEVKAVDTPVTFDYAARIAAYRVVQVRARVSGVILKRNFTEGAFVEQGHVLFEIDPAPYAAELARAKAQLQQAEAQLNQATRDQERAAELFARGSGALKTRDDAVSAQELAAAGVAAAKAQLSTAQLSLDYTQVKAPISGVTSLQQLPEGSLVGTGADGLLTSITQLDPVYVNFSVSDREGAEIRKLLERGEASPEASKLRVKISFGDGETYDREASIDFTSSVIDVETGTLQARAVVFNPNRRLVPGQFVRATVVGLTLPNVITAPEKAVMQGPQGQFVYTVNASGAAELRPVTLDRKVDGGWIVASGLKENDRLITEGVIKVRPGAPVTAQAAAPQSSPNAAAAR